MKNLEKLNTPLVEMMYNLIDYYFTQFENVPEEQGDLVETKKLHLQQKI